MARAMKKKVNLPKKDAGRRLNARLKELRDNGESFKEVCKHINGILEESAAAEGRRRSFKEIRLDVNEIIKKPPTNEQLEDLKNTFVGVERKEKKGESEILLAPLLAKMWLSLVGACLFGLFLYSMIKNYTTFEELALKVLFILSAFGLTGVTVYAIVILGDAWVSDDNNLK